jgi:hypothetical protein
MVEFNEQMQKRLIEGLVEETRRLKSPLYRWAESYCHRSALREYSLGNDNEAVEEGYLPPYCGICDTFAYLVTRDEGFPMDESGKDKLFPYLLRTFHKEEFLEEYSDLDLEHVWGQYEKTVASENYREHQHSLEYGEASASVRIFLENTFGQPINMNHTGDRDDRTNL